MNVYRSLRCSHAEIGYGGMMATSTMGQVGGANRKGGGIVVRPASEVLKNPNRWFYTEFEIDADQLTVMCNHLNWLLKRDLGYDKTLILRYFLPEFAVKLFKLDKERKHICSELCRDLLAVNCLWHYAWEFNPSPFRMALRYFVEGQKFYNLDGSELI
jgi:hypothetical protein